MRIILASQSPRRKELMERAGFDFEIITSEVEEVTKETAPDKIVMELSKIKARAVFDKLNKKESVIVIGADTVVAKDGAIMGKPKTEQEAMDMIESIQDDIHQVYTGVTIIKRSINGATIVKSFAECTDVAIYKMSQKEIRNYVATGDCMDKAGAYGIQGPFGVYVRGVGGDYNNVVGLPIARLYQELKKIK